MGEVVLTCHQCKARLHLAEPDPAALRLSGSGSGLCARLEESFLLLGGGEEASRAAQQHAAAGGVAAGPAPPRRLDESFVVLPGAAGGAPAAGAPAAGAQSSVLEGGAGGVQRVPFERRMRALARVFEVASGEAGVELPVCVECAADVHRELEAQLGELQQEVAAYESALARLELEGQRPLEEEDFRREEARARAEVERERELLEATQRRVAAARAELAAVEAQAAEVEAQEARYWHAFNDFQLRLRGHMEERDGMEHRLEAASRGLAMLRRTSVYHDVFRIWFDGACGTISGLRLGRTAQQPVEWAEINAAWGQAVLLLATLGRRCGVTFRQYRLLPCGSFPRVAEARRGGATHDLHGPVSKFLCASYDRAQVGFLACLRELAEALAARGARGADGAPFRLPCAIEGDRVAGLTVRLMFNKDRAWTRALKHMLVDLKVVLKYALAAGEAPPPAAPAERAPQQAAQRQAAQRQGGAPGGGGAPPVAALQREEWVVAAAAAVAGGVGRAAAAAATAGGRPPSRNSQAGGSGSAPRR